MKSRIPRHGLFLLATCLTVLSLALSSFTPGSNGAQGVDARVARQVLEAAQNGPTEFLVLLRQQADLSPAASLNSKLEKGRYVYERLTEVAHRTQPPLIAALKGLGAEYRPYWVVNLIWVRGDLRAIQAMAARPDVAYLAANPQVPLLPPYERKMFRRTGERCFAPTCYPPADEPPALYPQTASAIEWNLLQVNADKVWAMGYTGQGAVVGGQDTGYQWDHPALKNLYRGWDGSQADHNYNWHDAIHDSSGNPCGNNALAPCDDLGHGTHTMGIAVGDDGATNHIGMAPGARWVGCRNMNKGIGTPARYLECFQWFIAPTDLNGQNPRPDLAPDVINNSWGCPPSEGCDAEAIQIMESAVNNVRAAGILVVASAGNYGNQGCGSVNDPPALYQAALSVGATDSNDAIASFSSRGPADYTNLLKPDVSAPGVGVRSAWLQSTYQTHSGTSMAAPHVAGLAALLISVNPALRGQVETLETLIKRSALPRAGETCGGVPGGNIPNHTYGWGRIDAQAAIQTHYLALKNLPSTDQAWPHQVITYTLRITHSHVISPTTNVVLTDTLPVGTTFITATLPHVFDGVTVRWDFPSLAANATRSVQLSVRVLPTASDFIVNKGYGVRSDQVSTIAGAPIFTAVIRPIYFPLVWR